MAESHTGGYIVRMAGLSAGYDGKTVVSDVDMAIRPGEFVGIVGPSGSGKTTLMKVILGSVAVYDGTAEVEGRPVSLHHRPSVGYVPQLETIDWNFPVSVEEVVLMGRSMQSGFWPWPRREDKTEMMHLLDRLGIAQFRREHIRNLSGGQQQRVFLARALIRNPRLLILDEPTSGVDIKTRDDILHLLVELHREGVTVILSTHELNAVAAHLPRVICINRGIVADGRPSDIFTTAVLRQTYGGDMVVVKQDGMTLVADSPHFFDDAHTHEEPPKVLA